jgi:hypothetical protein
MKMVDQPRQFRNHVTGPDGDVLTLANLPSSATARWVPRRKAEIVAAVRGGLLTLDEACARFNLTAQEFLTWQEAMDEFGMKGLRATQPGHSHH